MDRGSDNTSVSSDNSSDSEYEKNSLSNYLPRSSRSRIRQSDRNTEAKRLSGTIKETTDALQDVDKMLGEFNSIARNQSKSIDKLRSHLQKEERRPRRSSTSSLRSSDLEYMAGRRQTYRTTSPLRDYQYGSDIEYRSSRRRPRSAVRFRDEIRVDQDHLHNLHQSVRDLSADHERLESELEREIKSRYRTERENSRSLRDLNTSLRQSQSTTHLDSTENIEKRLERKLESIATKIERQHKPEDSQSSGITAANLSRSLTEALQASQRTLTPAPPVTSIPHQALVDPTSQQRLIDLESDKRRLQNDIELVRQKFEQSEGARRALSSQLDGLRSQLREVDDERHRAIRIAEDYRDSEKKSRKKQREVSRLTEDENQRLQMEIQDLRVQLNHSISREEMEVLKRELQKTEKQRLQLSEHIETLTKDIRQKEQMTNTLQSNVTELTTAKSTLENQLSTTKAELERTKSSLKDSSQQAHKTQQELTETQSELEITEKRKEEMRNKATEAVKLWKAKCKNLQRDLEEYKTYSSEQENKNHQLIRENDSLKNQVLTGTNQVDRLAKEMADLLSSKQNLEEKLRKQELEIKDLRKTKTEQEHTNHEQSLNIQKLEREMRKMNDQFINYEAETAQLTDKLSAAKDQIEALEDEQRHLKSEYSSVQSELRKRIQLLADKDSTIQDLEARLLTTEASESACRRELDGIQVKLNKIQESQEQTTTDLLNKLEKLKKENNEIKARELRTAEEYHRKYKHLQADKEAAVEAMRLELDTAHQSVQNVKRQAKGQGEDFMLLEQKYKQVIDEYDTHKHQYKRVKEQVDDLREANEQQQQRCKALETDLAFSDQRLIKMEQQQSLLNQTVKSELQVVIETVESGSDYHYDNKLASDDPLSEITSKAAWLRRYIRSVQDVQAQLRNEMTSRQTQDDSEKRELIAEIKRTKQSMDELSEKHKELIEDSASRENEVAKLEDKVNELSTQVEEQIATDDILERSRILERYQRLQSAVNALKQELHQHSALTYETFNDQSYLKGSFRKSHPSRQVRISDIVTNDDGTRTVLKRASPIQEQEESVKTDLEERIEAYNKALGPVTYRKSSGIEIEEVKGRYINDIQNGVDQELNTSLTGSYRGMSNVRHHSTPKKTSSQSNGLLH